MAVKRNKLNIYLIKDDLNDFTQVIKEKHQPAVEIIEKDVHFYYKVSDPRPPDWVKGFLANKIDRNIIGKLKSQNSSSLILLKVKTSNDVERIFAVSFGYGYSFIRPAAIEENFGFVIAVNCMNKEKEVKRIRKDDLSNPKQSTEQSLRASKINNYGFDPETAMLLAIKVETSEDKQKYYGSNIEGGDKVSFNGPYDINNINDILKQCYTDYNNGKIEDQDNEYALMSKVHIINKKRQPKLIDTLNNDLVEKFNNKLQNQDSDVTLWIAPPYIEGDEATGFSYGKEKAEKKDDISIKVLRSLPNIAFSAFENIENYKIYRHFENGRHSEDHSLLECIYAEIEKDGKNYIFINKKWYKLDKDFQEEINSFFNNFIKNDSSIAFPNYSINKEKDYIKNVLLPSDKDMLCMDLSLRPNRFIKMGKDKSEVCDVLRVGDEPCLIHIKRYGSSRELNHLFNQGLYSAEYLKEKQYQEEAIQVIKKTSDKHGESPELIKKSLDVFRSFGSKKIKIVFAVIMNNSSRPFNLPFFSKVVLRSCIKDLQRHDYDSYLTAIKKDI